MSMSKEALEALSVDFENDPEIAVAFENYTEAMEAIAYDTVGDAALESLSDDADFDFSMSDENVANSDFDFGDESAIEGVGENISKGIAAAKNVFVTIWRKFKQFLMWIVDLFKQLARAVKTKLYQEALIKVANKSRTTIVKVSNYEFNVIKNDKLGAKQTAAAEDVHETDLEITLVGRKMALLNIEGKNVEKALRHAVGDPTSMDPEVAKQNVADYKEKCRVTTAVAKRFLKAGKTTIANDKKDFVADILAMSKSRAEAEKALRAKMSIKKA